MRWTTLIPVYLVSTCGILANSAAMGAPSCEDPVGEWTNQLGSTLKVTAVQNGMLQGTYVSPSGTHSEEHKLLGWKNEQNATNGTDHAVVISFSVNWGPSYGTITSWTGICRTENGASTLTAIWHLGMSNSVLGNFAWAHVLTGEDTFRPQ